MRFETNLNEVGKDWGIRDVEVETKNFYIVFEDFTNEILDSNVFDKW